MPFTYSILPDQNLVRQTLWGIITATDLRQMSIAMGGDPHYRNRMDIIADFRQATAQISYDEMMEFARFVADNGEIGKEAIVVSGQLEFGMARMFEQLTEHTFLRRDLKVFFDMDAAELWISNASATQPSALGTGRNAKA